MERHGAGGRARRFGVPAAVALLCLALSACQPGSLQFRADHRLTFETPKARARVTVPVTVSWRMTGFSPTGLDGSHQSSKGVFAVFVDRSPMPVGRDLRWLVSSDAGCKRDPRCPDAAYLADHGVYVTTTSSVVLPALRARPGGVGDEQHFVTVVLLDGSGHRIGESGWYQPFTTKRTS